MSEEKFVVSYDRIREADFNKLVISDPIEYKRVTDKITEIKERFSSEMLEPYKNAIEHSRSLFSLVDRSETNHKDIEKKAEAWQALARAYCKVILTCYREDFDIINQMSMQDECELVRRG